ncbi:ATPase AAA [Clostridia bacterium]|nr:ATPase AAA [Clostridia bacterium]
MMTNRFSKKSKIPFGFGQKITVPKTAQDTIPFIEAYDNGLFLVAPNTYSLIFAFDNIDYALLRDDEQKEAHESYQKLLNALPTDVSYQEFIMNSNVNASKLKQVLIPDEERYGELCGEYRRMMSDNITKTELAASDKIMLIALCYSPQSSIENANVLFKYYREMQTYFAGLKSDTRQLSPEEVFSVMHEFYHPFDEIEFLLPKNVYSKGGRIKDYIAPSMFAFKAKEIELGSAFTRILYVKSFDREVDDGFVRDLLDNNKKVTVAKHLHRLEKSEALDKVNKDILNAQESIQKRKETNHKSGMDFIPFRMLDRIRELEEMQTRLSGTNVEMFDVGVFIAISAETKDDLEELTLSIKAKALKHQVRLDIFLRQQEKGVNTVLPLGVNHFSVANGNNVNSKQLTDFAATLVPFSTRTYFSESGISYGLNKATSAMIVLDRTDEMNSNGFTLGASGSGKSMFTKSELIDVLFKMPNDEIIIVDPENEYLPLVKPFDGEIFKLSASSNTKMNIFDTDLSYSEDGMNAVSMKSEFIMTIVETAKGLPLTSGEKSLVDRCVKEVYIPFLQSGGDKEKLPTLIEFFGLLKKQPEREAKDIATVLELYVTGSFNTFAGKTNININRKFLVIDILEMGDQLRTVGLQVILEFLWQRVIENKARGVRTWVWIDEFSIMFNDGAGRETSRSGDFFAKVYKRIRKHGGVVTGITQNITEVLQSKQAQTMLANSEFVVLLQQKKNDLEQLVRLFDLSTSQSAYLKTGDKGSGLIVCGKKVIPFEKKVPQDNLIYKICSTNFKEQQREFVLAEAEHKQGKPTA